MWARVKKGILKPGEDDSDFYPHINGYNYIYDCLEEEIVDKKYNDGSSVYEGDTITAKGMGVGIVVWSPSELQWMVKTTESPGGSMTVGSFEPLKNYFRPIKIGPFDPNEKVVLDEDETITKLRKEYC